MGLATMPSPPPPRKETTANHARYERAVRDPRPSIVVGVGPAGTGKTHIACTAAIDGVLKKRVQRLVVTRPAVALAGESHGYLPGGLDDKMMPYVRPVLDAIVDHGVERAKVGRMLSEGIIEICPIAFMRGRTFHDCYLVIDEAQNSTPEQMRMMLTRVGERCKVVVTGDLAQSDLAVGSGRSNNGLADLISRVTCAFADGDDEVPVDVVWFAEADVLRSAFAKKMVRLYGGG